MIKPEMVPDEVCLALKETLFSGPGHNIYATAIAAALSAWPGMYRTHSTPQIILPLPQEGRDSDADKRAAIADLERQGWKHDR